MPESDARSVGHKKDFSPVWWRTHAPRARINCFSLLPPLWGWNLRNKVKVQNGKQRVCDVFPTCFHPANEKSEDLPHAAISTARQNSKFWYDVSCLLQTHCHLSTKEKLSMSWEFSDTYWAIQAGLFTPFIFARHRLSPLAAFTSGAYFLHNGRRWQWICEFYTANFKGIFGGP